MTLSTLCIVQSSNTVITLLLEAHLLYLGLKGPQRLVKLVALLGGGRIFQKWVLVEEVRSFESARKGDNGTRPFLWSASAIMRYVIFSTRLSHHITWCTYLPQAQSHKTKRFWNHKTEPNSTTHLASWFSWVFCYANRSHFTNQHNSGEWGGPPPRPSLIQQELSVSWPNVSSYRQRLGLILMVNND